MKNQVDPRMDKLIYEVTVTPWMKGLKEAEIRQGQICLRCGMMRGDAERGHYACSVYGETYPQHLWNENMGVI